MIYLGANGASEADTDLSDNTSTTGEVDVGGSVTGNIGFAGDFDWFAVALEAGKTYQFDMEGSHTNRGTLENPFLAFLEPRGDTVGMNDNISGDNLNSRLTYTPPTTGTYTLSVRDVTPPTHVEGDTDLAGNATTRGVVEVDGLVAQGTIAAPVGVSGNYYRFDYDWFAVDLQAGRTYRVDLAPVIRDRGDGTYEQSLLPEIVALYDADSDYLHHTSDRESSGPGEAARVEFTPRASGAYYISVAGLGFTAGAYTLSVAEAN